MTTFYVLGASTDEDSYFCDHLARRIAKVDKSVTVEFELKLEVDYLKKLKTLTTDIGGELYTHNLNHIVIKNGSIYIGGAMALINLAKNRYGIEDAEIANTIIFGKMKKDETSKLLRELGHPCAFIDFTEDSLTAKRVPTDYGRLIIELYSDICPLACENFMKLCAGTVASEGRPATYRDCPIHRLVPGGWLQCGDIVDGSGAHSSAVVGEGGYFRDESFAVDFGLAEGGVVGYSSSAPHGNGSQFFITFGPCEWMQNSFVGFGRVIVGNSALRTLEREPVRNQQPEKRIIVSSCGIELSL